MPLEPIQRVDYAVGEGLEKALEEGYPLGFPFMNVSAELYDGKTYGYKDGRKSSADQVQFLSDIVAKYDFHAGATSDRFRPVIPRCPRRSPRRPP